MRTGTIAHVLEAKILLPVQDDEMEFSSACGSDLMSDVMAFIKDSGNVVLLTGLINPQVIRTAEMMDIKMVVFVRGKLPGIDILELARVKGIAVLCTQHSMFHACGRLYSAGIINEGDST